MHYTRTAFEDSIRNRTYKFSACLTRTEYACIRKAIWKRKYFCEKNLFVVRKILNTQIGLHYLRQMLNVKAGSNVSLRLYD